MSFGLACLSLRSITCIQKKEWPTTKRKSDKTLNMHAVWNTFRSNQHRPLHSVNSFGLVLECCCVCFSHRKWWYFLPLVLFFIRLQHAHLIFHVLFIDERVCVCVCIYARCSGAVTTIDHDKLKMNRVFHTDSTFVRVDNVPRHIQFRRRAHFIWTHSMCVCVYVDIRRKQNICT